MVTVPHRVVPPPWPPLRREGDSPSAPSADLRTLHSLCIFLPRRSMTAESPAEGARFSNDPVCARVGIAASTWKPKIPPRVSPPFLPVCCKRSPLPSPHLAETPSLLGRGSPSMGAFSCCPSLYQAQDFCFRKQAALSAPGKFLLSSRS